MATLGLLTLSDTKGRKSNMDDFFKKLCFHAGQIFVLVVAGCGLAIILSLTMMILRFMWNVV